MRELNLNNGLKQYGEIKLKIFFICTRKYDRKLYIKTFAQEN